MAKILIIDDDPVICETLACLVRKLGHEVKSTFTVQDGLIDAGSQSFDIVFLDVQLPDGNGLDLLP